MTKNCLLSFMTAVCIVFLPGCISTEKTSGIAGKDPLRAYDTLTKSQFAPQIEKREQTAGSGDNPPRLFLELSVLYAHKNNPGRDFEKALQWLDRYAGVEDRISMAYARYLLETLAGEASDCDKLRRRHQKLTKAHKKIKEYLGKLSRMLKTKERALREKDRTIAEYQRKIQEKNDVIERLKTLDIHLESQRLETK